MEESTASVPKDVPLQPPTTVPTAQPYTGRPPPSPLSGGYLLIVISETLTDAHKAVILQKLAKAFLSWNVEDSGIDIERELAIVTALSPEGDFAKNGERLIQNASEHLVTEILIHPQINTMRQCIRNLLSSFTKYRFIIHAGYVFCGNGSWILQDGTFSVSDFIDAFQEIEVQRVIRAYEKTVKIDICCIAEGGWTQSRLQQEPFSKLCQVEINPSDKIAPGNVAVREFIDYLEQYIIPSSIEDLLEPSDIVGNIRFTHPTLYVFPGGEGDAALFGINGFNMLVDGGFGKKACFWNFVRHLDRLDAVLMTRVNNSNIGGMSGVVERKVFSHVYPQVGHFFSNLQARKQLPSPDGDKDREPLLVNLIEEGDRMVMNLKQLQLKPHHCYRDATSDPINLYHKVGHGKLDMYVISPAKDSREVKEFLSRWNNHDVKLFSGTSKTGNRELRVPLQNLVSICALLVWQPANPDDNITRILFPGSTPQHKIFEGLERLKPLEFLKHSTCTVKSVMPAQTPLVAKPTAKKFVSKLEKSDKILDELTKSGAQVKSTLAANENEADSGPRSLPVDLLALSGVKSQPSKPKRTAGKLTEKAVMKDIKSKTDLVVKESTVATRHEKSAIDGVAITKEAINEKKKYERKPVQRPVVAPPPKPKQSAPSNDEKKPTESEKSSSPTTPKKTFAEVKSTTAVTTTQEKLVTSKENDRDNEKYQIVEKGKDQTINEEKDKIIDKEKDLSIDNDQIIQKEHQNTDIDKDQTTPTVSSTITTRPDFSTMTTLSQEKESSSTGTISKEQSTQSSTTTTTTMTSKPISRPAPRTQTPPKVFPAKSLKDENNRKVAESKPMRTAPPKIVSSSKQVKKEEESIVKAEKKPIVKRIKPAAVPSSVPAPVKPPPTAKSLSPVKVIRKPMIMSKKPTAIGDNKKLKPDNEKTDSSAVLTPSTLDADTTLLKTKVKSESIKAKSESIKAKSESSKVKSESIKGKSESIKGKSVESIKDSSKLTAVKKIRPKPKPTTETQPTKVISEPKAIKPIDLSVPTIVPETTTYVSNIITKQGDDDEDEILIIETTEMESVSKHDYEEQKHLRDQTESEKQTKDKFYDTAKSKDAQCLDFAQVNITKASKIEEKVAVRLTPEDKEKIFGEVQGIISTATELIATSGKPPVDQKASPTVDKPESPKPQVKELVHGSQETSSTTAPTMPEDEKIDFDEPLKQQEEIEEKYDKEETKEKSLENGQQNKIDVRIPLVEQTSEEVIRKAKRDIVKTPDEVADLPVHEEVDNNDQFVIGVTTAEPVIEVVNPQHPEFVTLTPTSSPDEKPLPAMTPLNEKDIKSSITEITSVIKKDSITEIQSIKKIGQETNILPKGPKENTQIENNIISDEFVTIDLQSSKLKLSTDTTPKEESPQKVFAKDDVKEEPISSVDSRHTSKDPALSTDEKSTEIKLESHTKETEQLDKPLLKGQDKISPLVETTIDSTKITTQSLTEFTKTEEQLDISLQKQSLKEIVDDTTKLSKVEHSSLPEKIPSPIELKTTAEEIDQLLRKESLKGDETLKTSPEKSPNLNEDGVDSKKIPSPIKLEEKIDVVQISTDETPNLWVEKSPSLIKDECDTKEIFSSTKSQEKTDLVQRKESLKISQDKLFKLLEEHSPSMTENQLDLGKIPSPTKLEEKLEQSLRQESLKNFQDEMSKLPIEKFPIPKEDESYSKKIPSPTKRDENVEQLLKKETPKDFKDDTSKLLLEKPYSLPENEPSSSKSSPSATKLTKSPEKLEQSLRKESLKEFLDDTSKLMLEEPISSVINELESRESPSMELEKPDENIDVLHKKELVKGQLPDSKVQDEKSLSLKKDIIKDEEDMEMIETTHSSFDGTYKSVRKQSVKFNDDSLEIIPSEDLSNDQFIVCKSKPRKRSVTADTFLDNDDQISPKIQQVEKDPSSVKTKEISSDIEESSTDQKPSSTIITDITEREKSSIIEKASPKDLNQSLEEKPVAKQSLQLSKSDSKDIITSPETSQELESPIKLVPPPEDFYFCSDSKSINDKALTKITFESTTGLPDIDSQTLDSAEEDFDIKETSVEITKRKSKDELTLSEVIKSSAFDGSEIIAKFDDEITKHKIEASIIKKDSTLEDIDEKLDSKITELNSEKEVHIKETLKQFSQKDEMMKTEYEDITKQDNKEPLLTKTLEQSAKKESLPRTTDKKFSLIESFQELISPKDEVITPKDKTDVKDSMESSPIKTLEVTRKESLLGTADQKINLIESLQGSISSKDDLKKPRDEVDVKDEEFSPTETLDKVISKELLQKTDQKISPTELLQGLVSLEEDITKLEDIDNKEPLPIKTTNESDRKESLPGMIDRKISLSELVQESIIPKDKVENLEDEIDDKKHSPAHDLQKSVGEESIPETIGRKISLGNLVLDSPLLKDDIIKPHDKIDPTNITEHDGKEISPIKSPEKCIKKDSLQNETVGKPDFPNQVIEQSCYEKIIVAEVHKSASKDITPDEFKDDKLDLDVIIREQICKTEESPEESLKEIASAKESTKISSDQKDFAKMTKANSREEITLTQALKPQISPKEVSPTASKDEKDFDEIIKDGSKEVTPTEILKEPTTTKESSPEIFDKKLDILEVSKRLSKDETSLSVALEKSILSQKFIQESDNNDDKDFDQTKPDTKENITPTEVCVASIPTKQETEEKSHQRKDSTKISQDPTSTIELRAKSVDCQKMLDEVSKDEISSTDAFKQLSLVEETTPFVISDKIPLKETSERDSQGEISPTKVVSLKLSEKSEPFKESKSPIDPIISQPNIDKTSKIPISEQKKEDLMVAKALDQTEIVEQEIITKLEDNKDSISNIKRDSIGKNSQEDTPIIKAVTSFLDDKKTLDEISKYEEEDLMLEEALKKPSIKEELNKQKDMSIIKTITSPSEDKKTPDEISKYEEEDLMIVEALEKPLLKENLNKKELVVGTVSEKSLFEKDTISLKRSSDDEVPSPQSPKSPKCIEFSQKSSLENPSLLEEILEEDSKTEITQKDSIMAQEKIISPKIATLLDTDEISHSLDKFVEKLSTSPPQKETKVQLIETQEKTVQLIESQETMPISKPDEKLLQKDMKMPNYDVTESVSPTDSKGTQPYLDFKKQSSLENISDFPNNSKAQLSPLGKESAENKFKIDSKSSPDSEKIDQPSISSPSLESSLSFEQKTIEEACKTDKSSLDRSYSETTDAGKSNMDTFAWETSPVKMIDSKTIDSSEFKDEILVKPGDVLTSEISTSLSFSTSQVESTNKKLSDESQETSLLVKESVAVAVESKVSPRISPISYECSKLSSPTKEPIPAMTKSKNLPEKSSISNESTNINYLEDSLDILETVDSTAESRKESITSDSQKGSIILDLQQKPSTSSEPQKDMAESRKQSITTESQKSIITLDSQQVDLRKQSISPESPKSTGMSDSDDTAHLSKSISTDSSQVRKYSEIASSIPELKSDVQEFVTESSKSSIASELTKQMNQQLHQSISKIDFITTEIIQKESNDTSPDHKKQSFSLESQISLELSHNDSGEFSSKSTTKAPELVTKASTEKESSPIKETELTTISSCKESLTLHQLKDVKSQSSTNEQSPGKSPLDQDIEHTKSNISQLKSPNSSIPSPAKSSSPIDGLKLEPSVHTTIITEESTKDIHKPSIDSISPNTHNLSTAKDILPIKSLEPTAMPQKSTSFGDESKPQQLVLTSTISNKSDEIISKDLTEKTSPISQSSVETCPLKDTSLKKLDSDGHSRKESMILDSKRNSYAFESRASIESIAGSMDGDFDSRSLPTGSIDIMEKSDSPIDDYTSKQFNSDITTTTDFTKRGSIVSDSRKESLGDASLTTKTITESTFISSSTTSDDDPKLTSKRSSIVSDSQRSSIAYEFDKDGIDILPIAKLSSPEKISQTTKSPVDDAKTTLQVSPVEESCQDDSTSNSLEKQKEVAVDSRKSSIIVDSRKSSVQLDKKDDVISLDSTSTSQEKQREVIADSRKSSIITDSRKSSTQLDKKDDVISPGSTLTSPEKHIEVTAGSRKSSIIADSRKLSIQFDEKDDAISQSSTSTSPEKQMEVIADSRKSSLIADCRKLSAQLDKKDVISPDSKSTSLEKQGEVPVDSRKSSIIADSRKSSAQLDKIDVISPDSTSISPEKQIEVVTDSRKSSIIVDSRKSSVQLDKKDNVISPDSRSTSPEKQGVVPVDSRKSSIIAESRKSSAQLDKKDVISLDSTSISPEKQIDVVTDSRKSSITVDSRKSSVQLDKKDNVISPDSKSTSPEKQREVAVDSRKSSIIVDSRKSSVQLDKKDDVISPDSKSTSPEKQREVAVDSRKSSIIADSRKSSAQLDKKDVISPDSKSTSPEKQGEVPVDSRKSSIIAESRKLSAQLDKKDVISPDSTSISPEKQIEVVTDSRKSSITVDSRKSSVQLDKKDNVISPDSKSTSPEKQREVTVDSRKSCIIADSRKSSAQLDKIDVISPDGTSTSPEKQIEVTVDSRKSCITADSRKSSAQLDKEDVISLDSKSTSPKKQREIPVDSRRSSLIVDSRKSSVQLDEKDDVITLDSTLNSQEKQREVVTDSRKGGAIVDSRKSSVQFDKKDVISLESTSTSPEKQRELVVDSRKSSIIADSRKSSIQLDEKNVISPLTPQTPETSVKGNMESCKSSLYDSKQGSLITEVDQDICFDSISESRQSSISGSLTDQRSDNFSQVLKEESLITSAQSEIVLETTQIIESVTKTLSSNCPDSHKSSNTSLDKLAAEDSTSKEPISTDSRKSSLAPDSRKASLGLDLGQVITTSTTIIETISTGNLGKDDTQLRKTSSSSDSRKMSGLVESEQLIKDVTGDDLEAAAARISSMIIETKETPLNSKSTETISESKLESSIGDETSTKTVTQTILETTSPHSTTGSRKPSISDSRKGSIGFDLGKYPSIDDSLSKEISPLTTSTQHELIEASHESLLNKKSDSRRASSDLPTGSSTIESHIESTTSETSTFKDSKQILSLKLTSVTESTTPEKSLEPAITGSIDTKSIKDEISPAMDSRKGSLISPESQKACLASDTPTNITDSSTKAITESAKQNLAFTSESITTSLTSSSLESKNIVESSTTVSKFSTDGKYKTESSRIETSEVEKIDEISPAVLSTSTIQSGIESEILSTTNTNITSQETKNITEQTKDDKGVVSSKIDVPQSSQSGAVDSKTSRVEFSVTKFDGIPSLSETSILESASQKSLTTENDSIPTGIITSSTKQIITSDSQTTDSSETKTTDQLSKTISTHETVKESSHVITSDSSSPDDLQSRKLSSHQLGTVSTLETCNIDLSHRSPSPDFHSHKSTTYTFTNVGSPDDSSCLTETYSRQDLGYVEPCGIAQSDLKSSIIREKTTTVGDSLESSKTTAQITTIESHTSDAVSKTTKILDDDSDKNAVTTTTTKIIMSESPLPKTPQETTSTTTTTRVETDPSDGSTTTTKTISDDSGKTTTTTMTTRIVTSESPCKMIPQDTTSTTQVETISEIDPSSIDLASFTAHPGAVNPDGTYSTIEYQTITKYVVIPSADGSPSRIKKYTTEIIPTSVREISKAEYEKLHDIGASAATELQQDTSPTTKPTLQEIDSRSYESFAQIQPSGTITSTIRHEPVAKSVSEPQILTSPDLGALHLDTNQMRVQFLADSSASLTSATAKKSSTGAVISKSSSDETYDATVSDTLSDLSSEKFHKKEVVSKTVSLPILDEVVKSGNVTSQSDSSEDISRSLTYLEKISSMDGSKPTILSDPSSLNKQPEDGELKSKSVSLPVIKRPDDSEKYMTLPNLYKSTNLEDLTADDTVIEGKILSTETLSSTHSGIRASGIAPIKETDESIDDENQPTLIRKVIETTTKFTSQLVGALQQDSSSPQRSHTPCSDDRESDDGRSDTSLDQCSRITQHSGGAGRDSSQICESDEDEELAGSTMSTSSNLAHFKEDDHIQEQLASLQEETIRKMSSSMTQSFYGTYPDDDDDDDDELPEDSRPTSMSTTAPQSGQDPGKDDKKDPIKDWGRPLGLPNVRNIDRFLIWNPIEEWGRPLGLPTPAPPPPSMQDRESSGDIEINLAPINPPTNNAAKSTPTKKVPKKPVITEKISTARETSKTRDSSVKRTKSTKPTPPVYVDLAYVPHHGNPYYTTVEFFKRIRARYYVFSGTDPSKDVFNALIDAKKTWEDQTLEVTIIPTYDTDVLGYWITENEETLANLKIDLSPSASRCTINLQDHDTSCSAYRLEF